MIFYLIGIRIFYGLIKLASFFNEKANYWIKGRKGLFQKMKNEISHDENIAWFHCASLGEFEQGRPVIEEFKKKYPDFKILLTFFSPSGYEIRKNYSQADYIYYLPLDTPGNAKKFLEIVQPRIVFFVKYEFWHYFIKEIAKRNVPLYLISGIFRKEQRFFKWYGFKARKMLKAFNHFFVQNEDSKNLLVQINLNNATISGDTRFDRVNAITRNAKDLDLIETYVRNRICLVAGSTWKPDEDIIIKYYLESNSNLGLIIAPHEIHKENIKRIQAAFGYEVNVLLYSQANQENIAEADVILIDSIGLLSSLYRYASIAYIGGGFGKGIHNTLEAATFGLPIFFGPNYRKFQEAKDLIDLQSAQSIIDFEEFKLKLDHLLNDDQILKSKGQLSSNYVLEKLGATNSILEKISTEGF